MKNLIIILVILLSLQVNAQTTFTLDSVAYIKVDENNETVTRGFIKEYSIIKFDDDATSFKHITESKESKYYIYEMSPTEREKEIEMIVVSDAGNKYRVLINRTDDVIVFYFEDSTDFIVFSINNVYEE